MAAPTFVGASAGVGVNAATSTITVAAPSGAQAGDHQLAFVVVFNTSTTVSAPSGWSLVGSQTNTTSGTPFRLFAFQSATSTGSASFGKGSSAPAVAVRVAYRGGPGVAAVASRANGSTSSHELAAVTTTSTDSLVIGVLAEGTTSTALEHTAPSGWNGAERVDYASNSSIGRVGMLAVYDTVVATPGSQGGTISSSTSGHSATITIALHGVTAGGSPGGGGSVGEDVDFDSELNWVAPALPGDYVIRYEVHANEGWFTDDLTVTVSEVPTGPQTFQFDSIPPQAALGDPSFDLAPPPGAPITYPDSITYPGPETFPGFGQAPQDLPQTVTFDSITSRALVGEPQFTIKEPPEPIEVDFDSIPARAQFGAPSFTIGAAPPDQPILDLSLSLFAIDPATGYGIPLPDFESLELSPLRNSGGSIKVEYPATGRNFAVLRDAITSGRDIEVEIWTSGTAAGALRGYLQEAEGDDVTEDAIWTFAGGFLGLRMEEAVVEPQDPGPLVPDNDDNPDNDKHANEKRELIFVRATPGTVMATAMQQAQARGVLTDIVWDFTATHDSDGEPWPQVISSKFSPGATYKQILDRLVTLGLAEWDVQWTGAHRVLKMWVPEGRGEDLTLLDPPVVLRHGQNILDAPRKWSVREAGTDVWVAGSEGLYDSASDATALARRGRKIERFVSANNLSDDEAVTAYAFNQLPVITAGLHEVTHGIGFLPGAPRPIVTYDVGDWVWSEAGGMRERLRVVQWTLKADRNQQLEGTVTLNDTQTDWLIRLKARLEAIEAGETVVGTSTPSDGFLDDITPPAAPEGLVATSIAYTDPAHTNPLASVTASWLPVTTNADGSNYPQVQAARHIIIRLQNVDPERPETHIRDDWTWEECPRVVTDYAKLLRAEYVADGSPADQIAWLQDYVDTFSATPTATDDVAGYKVRYAYIGLSQVGGLPSSDPFPDEERFYYEATPSSGITSTSYTWGGVEAGANIRIEVQAFDRAGNHGPWASIGHDTASDDTPPPRPGPPQVEAWFRTLNVTWDGLGFVGEPMPIDFDHVEVWVSQSADFSTALSTASQAKAFDPLDPNPQHVGNLYAAGTHNITDLPHGVGFYAALRAVDRAGNVSEMSQQSGPVVAEQLFPDDLRDQIINDSRMIAHETIGTAHIVDAAIISAKIAELAVNDAHIESLNVGKLRSGTMTAQVTISGKFRTHPSDAANRVEFDAAGIRLYQGTQVVGAWNVADGSMLVTGTYRSALSGERINIFPDGTLRFYPQSGTNYSQMSTVGAEVIWRGPINSDGRSGRLNVNALGVGMNYSAESEIPNNLRAEMVVFDRRARITSPFIAFEVNGKLSTTDGSRRRVQFYQTSSSGTAMPYSYVQYGTSSVSGRGGFFGNGSGWKFEAGNMLVTDESLNSFGPIKASDFVTQSSREVKRDIVDVEDESVPLDVEQVFRDAPAVAFNYLDDDPSHAPRLGVIAEDLPEWLQELGPDGKGGVNRGLSIATQLGLHHAAIRRIIARLDRLEGRE